MNGAAKITSIDGYIAAFAPEVRIVLRKIRRTIRKAAPNAEETISYEMPAFRQNGMLIYFAAFNNHIGLYPPVRESTNLIKACAKYAGPKGNLKFPLDQPIPYQLISRITKLRVRLNTAEAAVPAKLARRPIR